MDGVTRDTQVGALVTSDQFDLTAEVAEAAGARSSAWRFVARFGVQAVHA